MTLREYRIRMQAYQLQLLDQEYLAAYSAWMQREVGAQKKSGKKRVPVYKKFEELFNYSEERGKILKRKKVADTSTPQGRYMEFMKNKKGQQKNNG